MEFESARELISYQAERLIATGATDPDRISTLCHAAGVQSINLDLPGNKAPSVISDNYAGARSLTTMILDRCQRDLRGAGPLRFVDGRLSDHNTAARLRVFLDAHQDRGIAMPETQVLSSGYSATSAARALADFTPDGPGGLFVNSTISLEGVLDWHNRLDVKTAALVRYGCFDWDPFGSLLPGNIGMVEQDVAAMLTTAFDLIGKSSKSHERILIPCKLRAF